MDSRMIIWAGILSEENYNDTFKCNNVVEDTFTYTKMFLKIINTARCGGTHL